MFTIAKFYDAAQSKGMLDMAQFTPQTPPGAPVSVRGYFTANYVEPLDLVGSSEPAFRCESTSVPLARKGDLITVNAVNYKVREVNANTPGIGEVVLLLSKV